MTNFAEVCVLAKQANGGDSWRLCDKLTAVAVQFTSWFNQSALECAA